MRLQPEIVAYLVLALVMPKYVLGAAEPVEKVRDKVTKYSERKNTTVVVKLKDGEVLKGSVSQASEVSFTMAFKDGRPPTTVAYGDVAGIKKARLHPVIVIGIVGGVVFGVLVAAMYASCGSGGC